MARIRSIKPEFWTDEKLSLLDPLTRLVFLGLISMADDAGRLVDSVRLLDGQLFPNTEDTCKDSLEILARMSRIVRYRSSSGQALIQILNWERHQKIDNPNKYTLPGPDTAAVIQPVVVTEDAGMGGVASRDPSESRASESGNPSVTIYDLRSAINDQRSTTRDRAGDWVQILCALWKTHRKGRVPRERIESELAELHSEVGTATLEQAALRFLTSPKAQYGVSFFAANFGDFLGERTPVTTTIPTKADRLRAQQAALRGTA